MSRKRPLAAATESKGAQENRKFWNPSSRFDPWNTTRINYPKPPMLTSEEANAEGPREEWNLLQKGQTVPSRTHPRWEDDPDGHGGTLHVYGARSVRIEDEVLWAKWKSDVSSFPMFILNFIATKKHHGEASAIWKLESRRTGLPYNFWFLRASPAKSTCPKPHRCFVSPFS
jgi:hypothetical protein